MTRFAPHNRKGEHNHHAVRLVDSVIIGVASGCTGNSFDRLCCTRYESENADAAMEITDACYVSRSTMGCPLLECFSTTATERTKQPNDHKSR